MNAKERIEWTDAEIALREVMDDDEALSALQILQARGWHPPDRLVSIEAERDSLRDQRDQALREAAEAVRDYLDVRDKQHEELAAEVDAREAAEARVEALKEALRQAAADLEWLSFALGSWVVFREPQRYAVSSSSEMRDIESRIAHARAALAAARPVQDGE